MGEEFVQYVERRDGSNISRAKNKTNTVGFLGMFRSEASGGANGARRNSWLHPDFCAEAMEQQAFVRIAWQNRNAHPAPGSTAQRELCDRAHTVGDSGEGLFQHGHGVQHDVRTRHPLFADVGRTGGKVFRRRAGSDPLLGGVRNAIMESGEKVDPLKQRHLREADFPRGQIGDRAVELGPSGIIQRARRCGRDHQGNACPPVRIGGCHQSPSIVDEDRSGYSSAQRCAVPHCVSSKKYCPDQIKRR